MFKRAFTLAELAAVLVVLVLVTVVLGAPGTRSVRMEARARSSGANLLTIGQGSAMYSADNAGAIHSFSWLPGVVYAMPDGTSRGGISWASAAAWQELEILMRRTGRITGPHKMRSNAAQLPHRRMSHVVLMDYLEVEFPSSVFADPADANQLEWQADPLDLTVSNNIPYAPGSAVGPGYHDGTAWSGTEVRQRWAYGSSYQRAVHAWNPDGRDDASYVPVSPTPHSFSANGTVDLSGRRMDEVVFPSAKVEYFEEFDREFTGGVYFGYDFFARPDKLMFDGSVNAWASSEAHASWNPSQPKRAWVQIYVPLHTFPIPLSGLGETIQISQRYRWTLGGLKGVDYPQPLMGNPNHGRNSR